MRDESINFIFTILEKVNFQIIGTALLAILIPLVIGILNHFYQKKEDQTKDFAILDLHVILDEVFKFQWLPLYVALIFLPTMFWKISSDRGFHFIEITLSVMGVWFMVRTLFNIYHWVKGNASEFRFSYLWYLENHEDMEAVWQSVWQAENINLYEEIEYSKTFSFKIDKLLKTDEKLETTAKLLDDFKKFIDKRSTFSLVEKIFPKILEWHYRTWKIEKNSSVMKKKSDMEKLYIFEIHDRLSFVVKNIEERALKGSGLYSPFSSYTKDLKQHSEAHKNEEKSLLSR